MVELGESVSTVMCQTPPLPPSFRGGQSATLARTPILGTPGLVPVVLEEGMWVLSLRGGGAPPFGRRKRRVKNSSEAGTEPPTERSVCERFRLVMVGTVGRGF